MRRRQGSIFSEFAGNPLLVGAMIMLVGLTGVVLSYNANKGLPFVPTYQISADVPDAAELIAGGSEVRIGGARVGIVKAVTAEPGKGNKPAYARLSLALDKDQAGLPADSDVKIRPRSVLGAKYLEIIPGHSRKKISDGGVIPVSHSRKIVELTEAFDIFDSETSRGIRDTITSLGNAFAGRGSQLNETLADAAPLLPRLERVTRTFASAQTRLPQFIRGAADASAAFAATSPVIGHFLDGANGTLAALQAAGNSLGATIEDIPPTEAIGTKALTDAQPVLDDAATIAHALRPAARVLPSASRVLASALGASIRPLKRTPKLSRLAGSTFHSLDRVALDKHTLATLQLLTQAVVSTASTLDKVAPAQEQCNVLGVYSRNIESLVDAGDAQGTWLDGALVIDNNQLAQTGTTETDEHFNPYANETSSECEAGNEPFKTGQQFGNPVGDQPNSTEKTSAPADATALAQKAGLLTPVPGAFR